MTIFNDAGSDYNLSLGHNHSIIVDSGTSFILMPQKVRESFVNYLKNDLNIACDNSGTFASCICLDTTVFPSLNFTFDNKSYFVTADEYILQDGLVCYIEIMEGADDDEWILGLNFFTNYYVVFDLDKLRVGFAPNIKASKKIGELANLAQEIVFETTQYSNDQLILFMAATGLSLIAFVMWPKKK